MVACIDYLCPTCGGHDPACSDCKGTGIVRLPAGTPVSFSKQFMREKPDDESKPTDL
jgi:hypothetical protein